MDPTIKKLFQKPLPVEQRVVGQVIRPLYHSEELQPIFHGKFRVCKESLKRSSQPKWEPWPTLDVLAEPKQIPKRLVTALPKNDPLRPLTKEWLLESPWTLLAYLLALGPVEAPIAAVLPLPTGRRRYIAYWGVTEPVGYRFHMIREQTPHQSLCDLVNSALLLVSRSVK